MKYCASLILTTAALVTCGIGPRSAHGKVQNKGYLSRNDWYVEILPKRFAYHGTKETMPATWPIFPSIGPAQETMTMNGESMILALGTFFYGSNFEKVAIDGDTTMLRLAENGTKFTPVTDEAMLVSTPTENCVLLCDLLKSKPTCSINDCSKSQNGHVYAMASSENAAKKSYSVWVGGDSGLTKVVVSGDLMIEDTVGDLLQTQAPVLSVAVSGAKTKYKNMTRNIFNIN